MTDDEVLALLVHLSTKLDALDARLTDLEARVEHLEVYAL
jgi:BMFP domain-containing protein YqiC